MCCAGNESDHCVHFHFNKITTIVNGNSTVTFIIIIANIKYAYKQTFMHDTNPQLSLSFKCHAQCKVYPTLLCALSFLISGISLCRSGFVVIRCSPIV